MSLRILIVEDEPALSMMLRYNLEAEGFAVETIAHGEEADLALRENLPDLLLLDWMLPGISGIELCRRVRARPEGDRLPIVMLTARGEEAERIRGLKTGADDYLVKPFSIPELVVRIRGLLRRAKPERMADRLVAGDIEIDRATRRVRRSGHEVPLGPTEFRLLEFLMSHPGRVHERQTLLDHVWGTDVYIDDRTVDVHVGRLRRVLNKGDAKDPIRTVRGTGYAFDETFGKP
ncbi:MAG: phosphate regulon transcriptional regulator PhoB [Proteobacteria bacterium]|nr:phosphate regulon transcriptional regulator PhoB [Pseudomonadota bacterium]